MEDSRQRQRAERPSPVRILRDPGGDGVHSVPARERAERFRGAGADRLYSYAPQGGDAGARLSRAQAGLHGFANRGIEMWAELCERAATVHDLQERAKDAFGENSRARLELAGYLIADRVP